MKKRIFTLVMVLMAIAIGAKAADYDLIVCGTQVKFSNRNDILGDGVFSYDISTKTLTVKGDLAYTGSEYVIDSQMSGLTINVAADSKLTSSKESVVHIGADTTITGQGKLAL